MLSTRAKRLCPYTAGEQPKDRQFIKLNTNENPYPPSPLAGEVLHSFDYSALKLYPDPDACLLKQRIAKSEDVLPENIFVGNGSDEVLGFAFYALFDNNVVFPDITYSFYPVYCQLYDISYSTIPLKNNLSIDILDYIGKDFGGIVIANPNAPTALALSAVDIEKIVSSVKCNVIVDEAYVDFANSGTSAVALTKKYDNLLVVKTFSKSYSLAGLRCGYAIGNSELIDGLKKVKNSFNSYPLDAVCQAVALAAHKDEAYHKICVDKIIATKNRVIKSLKSYGYFVTDSCANFVLLSYSDSASELYEYLRQNGVLTRWFNTPLLQKYLRVSIGTDSQMDTFLQLAQKFSNKIRQ